MAFLERELHMDCGGEACRRDRAYAMADLAKMYGGRTVGDLVSKLRCQDCGEAPKHVMLVTPMRKRTSIVLRGNRLRG